MADTPAPAPSGPSAPPTMSIKSSTAVAAGGGTSGAVLITFFWNWLAVRDWQAPQIDAATATNLALFIGALAGGLEIIVRYAVAWLPMPPTRNRRS